MKVRSPFGSNLVIRGLFALSLAGALAVAGAAPLKATAETAAPTPATASLASSPTTSSVPVEAAVTTVTPTVLPRAPKLTVRQIITKVALAKGLSKAEIAALMWMAKRESNFHPTSESRSECHGLFQLSKGMAHGHTWKDPYWNTARAIRYMKGRYGGVLKAKSFWMSHHWY